MSDGTGLGDRMKQYEQPFHVTLPRRTYTILRVDGRAFHTLLRKAEKPYDTGVMASMDYVALRLCTHIQGAKFGYVQSDEVSVLYTDFDAISTEPWFGGDLCKQISIAASMASNAFNDAAKQFLSRTFPAAEFDARVFTLSDPVEVANYFLWRQRDATRNSILSAGQTHFGHDQLQGKNTDQIQEMLWSAQNVNWNDYPAGFKCGRVAVKNDIGWHVVAAPQFQAQSGTFLAEVIPSLPSLHDE